MVPILGCHYDQVHAYRHISPELPSVRPNVHQVSSPQLYSEYMDVFALSSSIAKMCDGFFDGWTEEKLKKLAKLRQDPNTQSNLYGAKEELKMLLHEITNLKCQNPIGHTTAKWFANEWKRRLGFSSLNCFRPLESLSHLQAQFPTAFEWQNNLLHNLIAL